jgi:hypothetical protein
LLNKNELSLHRLFDKPVKPDKYFDDNGAGSDDAGDDYRLVECRAGELNQGRNLSLR